eukprot:1158780-Pelagomonas_calceolata.AAC.11
MLGGLYMFHRSEQELQRMQATRKSVVHWSVVSCTTSLKEKETKIVYESQMAACIMERFPHWQAGKGLIEGPSNNYWSHLA